MKDIYIKVKDVPDDGKLLALRYTKPHGKAPTKYWTQHLADYEEIDIPALLKEQRELCADVEDTVKAGYNELEDGNIVGHYEMIYCNRTQVINAPSPLDDYKARSVDFNTEEKP
jgi:hypothetical protein